MAARTPRRPQAARAPLADRDRLRLFVDGMADPVYVHDLDGRILEANRAGWRHLGLRRSDLLKRHLDELLRDLGHQELVERSRRLKTGESYRWSARLRRERGPAIPIEGHSLRTTFRRRPAIVSVLRAAARGSTAGTRAADTPDDRFRLLVEQLPDGFFLHDVDGVITDVNAQACRNLGYTRDELLRVNVGNIEQAVTFDYLSHAWRKMKPNVHMVYAGLHQRKDGTRFPVEINNRRLARDGGRWILALARDVSDSQRLEQLLQLIMRSTGRLAGIDFLRLLARELSEGIGVCCGFISEVRAPALDQARILAMWLDRRDVEPFDYPLKGTPCAEVFKHGYSVFEKGVPKRFPRDPWLRENGIESYVAIPFYGADGGPLGHIGLMDNKPMHGSEFMQTVLRLFACRAAAEIERQHVHRLVGMRERQLEILAQASKELNSDLQVDTIMRRLLQAAMQLSNAAAGTWGVKDGDHMRFREYYRGEEVMPIDYSFGTGEGVPGYVLDSRAPYVTNDTAHDPHVVQSIRKALGFRTLAHVPILGRTGELMGCFELHNKRGETGFDETDVHWLESLAADGAVALENACLVGEIRRHREELEQRVVERTAELETANEELQAFSYTVSHDLQAPLRRIRGFSDMLLEECADRLDETGMDYLRRLHGASRSMSDMINALLRFSRALHAPVSRKSVNISAMAREILDDLRQEDRQRQVEIEITPRMTARGDPHLLRLALGNLLNNAWKFTRKAEPARIRLTWRVEKDEAVYTLSDNGIGFAQEDAARVFQPFQRAHVDEGVEGMGIGLATARRIIERHGGRIWAEAEPGKGAHFHFTLPQE